MGVKYGYKKRADKALFLCAKMEKIVKKNLDFIFHADNNFVQIVTSYALNFFSVIKIRRDEKEWRTGDTN